MLTILAQLVLVGTVLGVGTVVVRDWWRERVREDQEQRRKRRKRQALLDLVEEGADMDQIDESTEETIRWLRANGASLTATITRREIEWHAWWKTGDQAFLPRPFEDDDDVRSRILETLEAEGITSALITPSNAAMRRTRARLREVD